jgi:CHAT domain-containing protein
VLSENLSRYRVVTFATHGLLAGELDGLVEPALVMTPSADDASSDNGLLTAADVATLKLSADWVILSACNTAAGDGTPGAEGLSGLARAFLFAGARSLLVSHWPVRDDVAARLTTETISGLSSSAKANSKAEAMQRAMMAIIADTRDPTLAHPAVWAPFIIVGEGR